MPVLTNAKHERFAQALAKGATAGEAYALAGYAPNPKNADRVKKNEGISRRIEEILRGAATRAEISVANLSKDLMRIAQKAEAIGDPAGLQAARASLMDVAKLNDLIVDRTENTNINHDVSGTPLSDEQWAAQHQETAH